MASAALSGPLRTATLPGAFTPKDRAGAPAPISVYHRGDLRAGFPTNDPYSATNNRFYQMKTRQVIISVSPFLTPALTGFW